MTANRLLPASSPCGARYSATGWQSKCNSTMPGGWKPRWPAVSIELAERHGVPWVVTNDPRYVSDEGRLVHDVLTALRAGTDLETATVRGLLHPNGAWRLRSPAEMATLWRGREQGLEASARIAAECQPFSLSWLRPPLPTFPLPERYPDDDSYLRARVYEGAAVRWGGGTLTAAQQRQIEHELTVIARLGFAGFFLVMWDAVQFTESHGILAQGRGSAANSAVAYCSASPPSTRLPTG